MDEYGKIMEDNVLTSIRNELNDTASKLIAEEMIIVEKKLWDSANAAIQKIISDTQVVYNRNVVDFTTEIHVTLKSKLQ